MPCYTSLPFLHLDFHTCIDIHRLTGRYVTHRLIVIPTHSATLIVCMVSKLLLTKVLWRGLCSVLVIVMIFPMFSIPLRDYSIIWTPHNVNGCLKYRHRIYIKTTKYYFSQDDIWTSHVGWSNNTCSIIYLYTSTSNDLTDS